MAYDAGDGYLLLFGGRFTPTHYANDTWKFADGIWTNITPSASPPGFSEASMVYDAADGYVLLFGGLMQVKSGQIPNNETWEFAAGVWTQLHPAHAPPGRSDAGIAYDAKDGYVVLFGGFENGTHPFGDDTWKFLAGSWTNITTGTSPSAREDASMAYSGDASTGEVVLSGGEGSVDDSAVWPSDTWTFSAGTWSVDSGAKTPSALENAATAYDPLGPYVLLYGGDGSSFSYSNSTWAFSGTSWTKLTPHASPPSLTEAAAAYDPSEEGVVLFGGENSTGLLGATWLFSDGNWSAIPPPKYLVTFDEAGLPPGTPWAVTLGGKVNRSAGETLEFTELPGNYSFNVSIAATYTVAPLAGYVVVLWANATKTLTFTPVTYLVTLSEVGLPTGATWWANLTSQPPQSSTSTSIEWDLQNGSYPYTVASDNKSFAAAGGVMPVNGDTVNETATFRLVTYTLTFVETGLPPGTSWSLTMNGGMESSNTSSIVVSEANGSYSFTFATSAAYGPSVPVGHITVHGANMTVPLLFLPASSSGGGSSVLGLSAVEVYALIAGAVVAVAAVAFVLLFRRGRSGGKQGPPGGSYGGPSPPAR